MMKASERSGRFLALGAAFFAWFCAGFLMAISSLAMRDAAKDLLNSSDEAMIGRWFGWLIGAFLCGAASGGYGFGWLGDRVGRARALGIAVLWYAVGSGLCRFVHQPVELLVIWFGACLGVGGIWPNAIALVSEMWPNMSRFFVAGAIGTSANLGILLFAVVATRVPITADSWRWVFTVSAMPAALGVMILLLVPESPRWLALRGVGSKTSERPAGLSEVFRPPLLRTTLVGIALGAVPLFGGWGSSNWANAWASQVGEARSRTAAREARKADPALKARLLISRSLPGAISSLLGGGLAVLLGRRRCYFLLSLAALGCAQYLFWFLQPQDPRFLLWNAALGLCSGFFFGWLPLCLPELFPTRVRSTGAGVSFNFGRIITAFGVVMAAELLKGFFAGDYAAIGRLTSLVYLLGTVVILFVPDTGAQQLPD